MSVSHSRLNCNVWKHVVLVLLICIIGVSTLKLGQSFVCQKTNSVLEDYIEAYTSTFRVKTYTWCLGMPPRCSKYKTQTRTSYRKSKRLKEVHVPVCCSGYKESGNKCIAECKNGCKHGQCIAPDVCDCLSGWRGTSCNSKCRSGTWGDNCMHTCTCQNGGICKVSTGQCSCNPGFHGMNCEFRCPDGTFGAHCSQRCKCLHGQGKCDPVSGRCRCFPGYHGPLCEKRCVSSFGQDCESECMCQNGGHCNPEDGSCICLPGWTGSVCANTCLEGRYGYRCKRKCQCYNGGTCDHISGSCNCTSGYTGSNCQLQCPLGMYGYNCSMKCLCKNNARCDPVDGMCVCTENFMGPHCSFEVCSNGMFGKGCKQICHCNVNTSTCDPWTGRCTCNKGYIGYKCEKSCDNGFYGVNCTSRCECNSQQICDNVNGCVAPSINYGQAGPFGERVEATAGLLAAVFFVLIILITTCLVIYYRRRYRRLKQTTELMVQYRVVNTDTSNVPGSSVDGATGTSENPAHRHFSSKAKRMEVENMEALEHDPFYRPDRGLQGHTSGRQYSHQDSYGVPVEPPPPYTPAPGTTGACNTLPPPYTAAPDLQENHRMTENSHLPTAVAGYGGVTDDDDDYMSIEDRDMYHAQQNEHNEYRENTPV